MKNKLEDKEVVMWIVDNSDNTELMDKINKLTFPFTSKYKSFSGFAGGKVELKDEE